MVRSIYIAALLSFVTLGFAGEPQPDTLLVDYNIVSVDVVAHPLALSSDETLDLKLNFEHLNALPKFMGSVDGVRTLQLMPGVQTTGDIASGLYVQGCEPAHNLFLLDGAPIYSPVHLLGFLPVFNSGHMESIKMDKGYISPNYSSRISSVVSVDSRIDIPEKVEVDGEVTLLSSALSVNIPIAGSGNVIASSRLCYVNPILRAVDAIIGSDIPVGYGMEDVNVTWTQNLGERDRIKVSGFYNRDVIDLDYIDYELLGENSWRNGVVSAQWEHCFSNQSTLSTTIYNTIYDDIFRIEQPIATFSMDSSINDLGAELKHDLPLGRDLNINYGASVAYRSVYQQTASLEGLSDLAPPTSEQHINNVEYGLFCEVDYSPTSWLDVAVGLRYSGVYGQSSGAEPRVGLKFKTSENTIVSASYTRQYQYINQVLVSNTAMSTNYFVATSEHSPAQRSDNLTLGFDFRSVNRSVDFSVMLFGRGLKNQYENGSKMISLVVEDTPIYSRFDIVDGVNFGSEFLIKYNFGKVKGWLSYTLAWALRQGDAINDGAVFYASNDRRHDLSLVGSYTVNPRWLLSSAFVCASGNPMTLTKGVYTVSEQVLTHFSLKNEARMPNYNRMDVTASYALRLKRVKQSSLNISIYNIYARRNPILYSSKIRDDGDGMELILKSSALYTILPSIGFTFKL